MSKKRNVAKPKQATPPKWEPTEEQLTRISVIIREAKLELLDKLVSTFISLINDIKAVV